LEVTVKDRSKPEPMIEKTTVSLDADPIDSKQRQFTPISKVMQLAETVNPVDDLVRRLNRLAWMADYPEVTGKLVQLGIQIGGDGVGELKENLYLNQVPHNRYVRRYFYEMAAQAALDAAILCSQGKISNRMQMVSMFPEMNPSMDSYRIGTLLELARTIAIRLAEENLRVRICVQGSMGVGIFTGVPKQLNGVATLLQRMDWQSEEGEENEGMVGKYVNFGAIGKEHVVNAHIDEKGNQIEQDDVFILLCPQSMVGVDSSVMGMLSEMVDAAGDRPVILINPDLADKVSAQGQQSVRGRQQRMDFANSFKTIFHFQNIYVSGTSYFPILGSITKRSPYEPWVAHQRRDRVNNEGEVYVPVLSCEEKPEGEVIMRTFEH
jgi:adenylate kinase